MAVNLQYREFMAEEGPIELAGGPASIMRRKFTQEEDEDDLPKPKRRKPNPNPFFDSAAAPLRGSESNPIALDSDDEVMILPKPRPRAEPVPHIATPSLPLELPQDDMALSTPEGVLKHLQAMFPDICPGYVLRQFTENFHIFAAGDNLVLNIVNSVLSMPDYPRKKMTPTPSSRNSIRWGEPPWHPLGTDPIPGAYFKNAKIMLLMELTDFTQQAIFNSLLINGCLYTAYVRLTDKADIARQSSGRLQNKRTKCQFTAEDYKIASLSPSYHDETLGEELRAAKLFAQVRDGEQESTKDALAREAQNEAHMIASGQVKECGCCFTDTPSNRMAHCSSASDNQHHFCYECARRNAETTIGTGNFLPKCMDISGCEAHFDDEQLSLCLEAKTRDLLLRKQQLAEVRVAIPDLEECPFCEYLVACVPIECNREFECANPDCKIVSCRLCHEKSHIPISCEEAASKRNQDKKLDHRHTVEEAMTDALVRTCNKCKNRFIKEDGCNKMTCTKCRNLQCYVCGENVKSYEHFGKSPDKCPVHDNYGVSVRHDDEVKKAEQKAKAKIQAENTEISEADLAIQVSAEVQKVEEERLQQAKGHGARGNPADPYGHLNPMGIRRYRAAPMMANGWPAALAGDPPPVIPGADANVLQQQQVNLPRQYPGQYAALPDLERRRHEMVYAQMIMQQERLQRNAGDRLRVERQRLHGMRAELERNANVAGLANPREEQNARDARTAEWLADGVGPAYLRVLEGNRGFQLERHQQPLNDDLHDGDLGEWWADPQQPGWPPGAPRLDAVVPPPEPAAAPPRQMLQAHNPGPMMPNLAGVGQRQALGQRPPTPFRVPGFVPNQDENVLPNVARLNAAAAAVNAQPPGRKPRNWVQTHDAAARAPAAQQPAGPAPAAQNPIRRAAAATAEMWRNRLPGPLARGAPENSRPPAYESPEGTSAASESGSLDQTRHPRSRRSSRGEPHDLMPRDRALWARETARHDEAMARLAREHAELDRRMTVALGVGWRARDLGLAGLNANHDVNANGNGDANVNADANHNVNAIADANVNAGAHAAVNANINGHVDVNAYGNANDNVNEPNMGNGSGNPEVDFHDFLNLPDDAGFWDFLG